MAGPAIRSWELAMALARSLPVHVASEHPIERHAPGIVAERFASDDELQDLAAEHDVVVVQGFALQRWPFLAHVPGVLVVDLYDPWVFENLAHAARQDGPAAAERIAMDVQVQSELLEAGDVFICASERQRDYWLGMLTARGRIDALEHARDPALRRLIDVVPFGCPTIPPTPGEPQLRGVAPGIDEDSFVFLWTGGAWEWFDPLLVVDAFAQVVEVEPDARLHFMGLELARADVPPSKAAQATRARAVELGLDGRGITFGGWVPYDERGSVLLEGDVCVLAARDWGETRMSFRSRMLDHLWAGRPTISTEGDSLGSVFSARGAGMLVAPGDVAAMRDAMLRCMRDDELRDDMSAQARLLADEHTWERAVERLLPVVEEPWRWQQRVLGRQRVTPSQAQRVRARRDREVWTRYVAARDVLAAIKSARGYKVLAAVQRAIAPLRPSQRRPRS
jgi:glycosyltransferase involved in cell wall biosynthesis